MRRQGCFSARRIVFTLGWYQGTRDHPAVRSIHCSTRPRHSITSCPAWPTFVDMTDELAAAAKKTDDATADLMSRLHREARAYKALQPILNAAVRESGDVKEQLASFLESSPRLARYLGRWQSEGAAPSGGGARWGC